MNKLRKHHPIQVQGRSPDEIRMAEEKKRKEDEEKKLNKTAAPKQRKHFDVVVEAMVLTTITYRVSAYDENDALIQINKIAPINIRPNVSKRKDIKAIVKEAGSSIIKLMKVFRV